MSINLTKSKDLIVNLLSLIKCQEIENILDLCLTKVEVITDGIKGDAGIPGIQGLTGSIGAT